MKRLEKIPAFPYYVFLIPVFYVWHKLNEYFGLIPIRVGFEIFIEYILLLTVTIIIGWILIRKIHGAALWAAYILSFYLFWGSFHDFLKDVFSKGLLSSYSFLIPSFTIIGILIIKFQRKKKVQASLWSKYLNSLMLLLIAFEFAMTMYGFIIKRAEKEMIDFNMESPVDSNGLLKPIDFPDIYFVVFDEYMSSIGLKTFLDFDNSGFDSILQSNGIYIGTKSKSNYNSTPHSIASALNMNYFPSELEGAGTDPRALLQGQLALKKAIIPKLLKEVGYKLENHGRMDIAGAKSPFEPFFNRDQKVIFRFDNLWYRVRNEIWWNFTHRFSWLRTNDTKWKKDQLNRVKIFRDNLNGLKSSMNNFYAQPKFVFAHFILPHPPYNFNRNGEIRDWTSLDRTTYRDSLYLDQILFANKTIEEIIQNAQNTIGRKKLLIIIGDHGFRDNHVNISKRIRDKQFMNLTAIYSSDQNYSGFYDSISPVNIFRVVLNQNFGTKLPMLKDSTIMLE